MTRKAIDMVGTRISLGFIGIAVVAMLVMTFSYAPLSEAAPQGEDKKREAGRKFQWTDIYGAKAAAKKRLYGIVWYFQPKGESKEHSLFESHIMFEQSLDSPIVKVTGEADREKLVPLYEVNEERHTVVVTDWHGNLIQKFEAKKVQQRLPAQKILSLVNNVRQFVAKLEKDIKKAYAKGEKEFEKKKWKKALKELLFVARSEGFDECDKAKAFIDDIETIGRDQLKKLETLSITDSEAALKGAKKIVKEFAGSAVEAEAAALVEKLKNKSS